MKKMFMVAGGLLVAAALCAQSNVSQPMSFHIEKEVVPPNLNIVPNSVRLVDPSNNNVIDGGETCKICFEVENTGRGDAFGCTAHVTAKGTTEGLVLRDISLPVIPSGKRKLIEIPIEATTRTQTGEVILSVIVNEPNGYGTDNIQYTLGTHKQRTPFVEVASYRVTSSKGGKLMPKEFFKLQIIVQNTDQGTAEDVNVALGLPNNVTWQGGTTKNISIGSMRPNETRILEYELMANALVDDDINIQVGIKERSGKYSKDGDIPLHFGQYVGSTIAMNVERHDDEVTIQKASLVSDVDENIPVGKNKNSNTFVLIIANENYQDVAPVPFALNDGNIFREYCIKTLGISEKHIKYLADATGNKIKSAVEDWLKNITEAFDDPQVIFYYAGHGIPDEASKTAYLLPVDGSGTNASSGYKLDDLYATLGDMPASRITVFMDACFSGSKREEGMLTSARGVRLVARPGVPKGNMVVFSAAQGNETAYPNREKQHGLFTYYLLKKLQETEGNVSLQELGNYITTNVKQQSILLNSKLQTPCVMPSVTLTDEWKGWKLK